MPAAQNTGEDYYGDGPAAPTSDAEVPSGEGESSSATALLPKSLCPGMNPGDTIELKIERVLDDQYEVSYSEKEEAEEEEMPSEEPMGPPAPEPDMGSMME